MAAQSDPDLNPNFRRRWTGPPLEKEKAPTAGTVGHPGFLKHTVKEENNQTTRRAQWACHLDRLADSELAVGRVSVAEYLSKQAAELREVTR